MRLLASLFLMVCLGVPLSAFAGFGRVIKVLPMYLGQNGQHALSPSLYDRDAYQAVLRQNPEQRSGLLMEVQWKTTGKITAPLRIRVELRGVAQGNLPKEAVIEKQVERNHWFTQWTPLTLTGTEYRDFGEITAWRVTLWEGDDLLLGEQRSFLW